MACDLKWGSQGEIVVIEKEKIFPGKKCRKIAKSVSTTTFQMQIHGKQTRYNTGRQGSRVGKVSGEEENVSWEGKINVILQYSKSWQD